MNAAGKHCRFNWLADMTLAQSVQAGHTAKSWQVATIDRILLFRDQYINVSSFWLIIIAQHWMTACSNDSRKIHGAITGLAVCCPNSFQRIKYELEYMSYETPTDRRVSRCCCCCCCRSNCRMRLESLSTNTRTSIHYLMNHLRFEQVPSVSFELLTFA